MRISPILSWMQREKLRKIAIHCPIVAAIFAPLSTLLDIPALTQHWYLQYGITQPDPPACLVLSGIGLFLNVLANILLILQFSARTKRWIWYTVHWSLFCWIGKTVVAAANLLYFGLLTRNGDGYDFDEGFWCAVVSFFDACVITLALLFHFIMARREVSPETVEIREEGRKFMLSVTAFLSIIAIQALVYSKLEDWEYSDGIYFSIQTALTIGYGDFAPTTTAGKILVLPFAILTISQLGNEISMIINNRTEARKRRWKKRYEAGLNVDVQKIKPQAGLVEEINLVHELNEREDTLSQYYDLMWSTLALLIFWLVGAVMFAQIQDWSYGNGVYAVIILSLTIGFGDYVPTQPASRILWIPYALMAVPIITSFAVQTISGLLSTFSQHKSTKQEFKKARTLEADMFSPHAAIVEKLHRGFQEMTATLPEHGKEQKEADDVEVKEVGQSESVASQSDTSACLDPPFTPVKQRPTVPLLDMSHLPRNDRSAMSPPGWSEVSPAGWFTSPNLGSSALPLRTFSASSDSLRSPEVHSDVPSPLLKQLIDRVILLEAEAREMLLDNMEDGVARTLLCADRSVQIRDVQALRNDNDSVLSTWRGGRDDMQSPHRPDSFSQVKRYRHTFAEILVLASMLQGLQGEEKARFERWNGQQSAIDDDDDLSQQERLINANSPWARIPIRSLSRANSVLEGARKRAFRKRTLSVKEAVLSEEPQSTTELSDPEKATGESIGGGIQLARANLGPV